MEKEKMKLVSAMLPPDIISEIDRIALKRKMGKGEVMRMLLGVGIDCHKDLEKIGIIPMMDFAYFMKKKMDEVKEDSKGKQLNLI